MRKDTSCRPCIAERLEWLDIAKGLTIILMVIGHTSIPDFLSRFIWSFHMPLFFISSGWVTNWEKYSISGFIVRKSRSIMLPFFIYSTIVLSIFYFTIATISFETWFKCGWQGYALWFIPVLYLSSIIGRIIQSFQSKYIRCGIMLLLLIAGVFFSFTKYDMPWNLSSVPFACFLVLLGTELKQLSQWINKPRWWIVCVGFALAICVSHFYRLDMCFNHISPVLPLTIGAVSGTLMIYSVSSYIANYSRICSRIIQGIGRETYIVVAFSQITIVLVNTYWTQNIFLKYTFLVVVLVTLTSLKNSVNRIAKTKIL